MQSTKFPHQMCLISFRIPFNTFLRRLETSTNLYLFLWLLVWLKRAKLFIVWSDKARWVPTWQKFYQMQPNISDKLLFSLKPPWEACLFKRFQSKQVNLKRRLWLSFPWFLKQLVDQENCSNKRWDKWNQLKDLISKASFFCNKFKSIAVALKEVKHDNQCKLLAENANKLFSNWVHVNNLICVLHFKLCSFWS